MRKFHILLNHQVQLRLASIADWFLPPTFLLMLVSVAGISSSQLTVEWTWIGILLAILMQLPSLFEEDLLDGTILQLIHRKLLFHFIWAKFLTWLMSLTLPILLILPVIAIFTGLSFQSTLMLYLALICSFPTLLWLGMTGAAITQLTNNNILILIVLILPLILPIILLGLFSLTNIAGILLLFGFSILTTTLCPFIIEFCLKLSI